MPTLAWQHLLLAVSSLPQTSLGFQLWGCVSTVPTCSFLTSLLPGCSRCPAAESHAAAEPAFVFCLCCCLPL